MARICSLSGCWDVKGNILMWTEGICLETFNVVLRNKEKVCWIKTWTVVRDAESNKKKLRFWVFNSSKRNKSPQYYQRWLKYFKTIMANMPKNQICAMWAVFSLFVLLFCNPSRRRAQGTRWLYVLHFCGCGRLATKKLLTTKWVELVYCKKILTL